MKLKPFASSLFLGIAGILLASSTQSEASLAYTDGDVLLGFRATGGQGATVDYLVNLGSASTFTNASSVLVLDTEIGNLLADLNVQYGSWQSRLDFFWSVSGVQKVAGSGFSNNTMFVTRAHDNNLTLGSQDSTAWSSPTLVGGNTYGLKVQAVGNAFKDGNTPQSGTATQSANVPLGLIQGVGNANSYASYMPNGVNASGNTSYVWFGGGIEGTTSNVLDFYTVVPGTTNGSFEGTFSIGSDATVTFTPAGIPEPASLAAIGGGLAVLASVRRRRAAL